MLREEKARLGEKIETVCRNAADAGAEHDLLQLAWQVFFFRPLPRACLPLRSGAAKCAALTDLKKIRVILS